MTHTLFRILFLGITLIITACGGGGGSNDTPPANDPTVKAVWDTSNWNEKNWQ